MKLGAHISTAKPFSDSIVRAKDLGCECMQIFANPPQRWNPVAISKEEIEKFKVLNLEFKINPIIIHSIYLINLASPNPYFYSQSIASLIDDMHKAATLQAYGVNTHLGSTLGNSFEDSLIKVVLAIKTVLADTDDNVNFIIENAAGSGNIIGDTLEEIATIIEKVNSSRVKVLIDTAHAFESGYDLRTAHGGGLFIDRFDELIGLDNLAGFHLNDSKTILNSKRDRHADLGQGAIGLEIFKYLVNESRLEDKFGILETPEDSISWREQLKLLRNLEEK